MNQPSNDHSSNKPGPDNHQPGSGKPKFENNGPGNFKKDGPPASKGPSGSGPGGPPVATSLIRSLKQAGYFAPYLKPVAFLIGGGVLLEFLATLFRLPLMYIPMVLTSKFGKEGENQSEMVGWLQSTFGQESYLLTFLMIAFVGMIGSSLLMLIRNYWAGVIGEHLLRAIRLDVFSNLKRLSMQAVFQRGAGQFVQRLTRDLFFIRDLFNQTLSMIIGSLLQITVFVTAMMWLEPWLTVLLLVLFAVTVPLIMMINRKVEVRARSVQQLGEKISSQLVESIGGYRDIIAGGHFDKIANRYDGLLTKSVTASLKTRLLVQYAGLLLSTATSLILIIPYFVFVSTRSFDSINDVGHVITYVGFWSMVLPSFTSIARSTSDLAITTPSLRAVRELLEPHPDSMPTDGPIQKITELDIQKITQSALQTATLDGPVQTIRFEGVGLKMSGRWIVQDLSFTIDANKMTAIIGQSGAGKTTVFHMLLRLIKPTCGSIWINDVPLDLINEIELRKLIGFIPQSPFIFNQSLRENILIGTEGDDTEELLQKVVADAQLEELVANRKHEGGLDAVAGFMGMKLSGGERQRIALGRLLIQDPQIIVCDEYTANIDVKTAQLISDMMVTRFENRTRIVITHELYTVSDADHILVLEQGRLTQDGTHEELLQQSGLYRSLWDAQKLG